VLNVFRREWYIMGVLVIPSLRTKVTVRNACLWLKSIDITFFLMTSTD